MENTLIFSSEEEVRFGKLLKYIIPTYLTSLFNTVYTIIDGIFVSAYVGTDALAAINIVYPLVNVLTGIALAFATGGSAVAALHIGGGRKDRADRFFSCSIAASILLGSSVSLIVILNLSKILTLLGATDLTMVDCKIYALWWLWAAPVVVGKELFTYFIRVDGSPAYSFATALSGGVLNIILDYILVGQMQMGIHGAALATILGLILSFCMGVYYFCRKNKSISVTLYGLSIRDALYCMVNGASEFVDQIAIAITTVVFNRTALAFAGENGVAAVSIIMYLQFLFIGIYFGFSMGLAPPLSYAYGDGKLHICRKLERYAHLFFCNRASHSLSADLLSCTGRRILLCGTNQPCIFHCHIRNANLRTWLSVFRDQYFRCRPDDGIRKRILLRADHISSLVCTAAFVSDHSADEIWSDWHMAGCSRSRSNDPSCCCMVSEAGPKVIAIDSRGRAVKKQISG